MARRLASAVEQAGGRAYYVGGFVRDAVLHRDNKDIDIEIHGLTPEQLEAILDSLGERTVMGASFGVYGLKHYGLDIAMPRSETKNGRGHRDFTICVDPFLGTEKAARRRDFQGSYPWKPFYRISNPRLCHTARRRCDTKKEKSGKKENAGVPSPSPT